MNTILSKLILCCALLVSGLQAEAANYYFSNETGDDSRSASQAQNPSTPWKSINKLNAVFSTLKPGDAVLFRRGETFYGTIHINASGSSGNPIKIGAYGSGSKPIITSLEEIKGWKSIGNGIYESTNSYSPSEVSVVLLDDKIQEKGRYPNRDAANGGYLTIDSNSGNSAVTSKDLPSSPSFSGGEVVIRKIQWIIDRHPISSHSGNTINYAGSGPFSPSKGYGFFIQGHLGTLDRFGEWFYSKASKKLNVFFGSSGPGANKVFMSTADHLLTKSYNASHILIENINFRGSNKDALHLAGGDGFKIINTDINYAGENGVIAMSVTRLEIDNCNVSYSLNNGIYLRYGNVGAKVTNSKVENTFPFQGGAQNGDNNGVGIFTRSDNALVENNIVRNTGFNGIFFMGNETIIKNNLVDGYCLLKNDGGGIYSFGGNTSGKFRKVENNIILNGRATNHGTPRAELFSSKPHSSGIFLDDNVDGVDIINNTIAHTEYSGIKIANAKNINVRNNLFYDTDSHVLLGNSNNGGDTRNISLKNNVYFSKHPDQMAYTFRSNQKDIPDIGSFDNNHFVRPLGDNHSIYLRYGDSGSSQVEKYLDLKRWQKSYNKDVNSKTLPSPVSPFEVTELIGKSLYENINFLRNITGFWCNDCQSSWVTGKLNGGSLKVESPSYSSAAVSVGSVNKDKNYVLKFKAVASKQGTLRVFLRHTGSPWQQVSPSTTLNISTSAKEYSVLIQPYTNVEKPAVMLVSDEGNWTYWIDDFELKEAKVNITKPEEVFLFEYNHSKSPKTVSLDGNYVDGRNKPYSGKIEIPPYSSVLLIKTSGKIESESAKNSLSDEGIFINVGGTNQVSHEGVNFVSDTGTGYFSSNSNNSENNNLSSSPLFQTYRFANTLTYKIPVPNGNYKVITYHKESYFGTGGRTAKKGQRVFDILIENKTVKKGLDMFVENQNKETTLAFENIQVRDGEMEIKLVASANNATLSGIAVIPLDNNTISEKSSSTSIFINAGSNETATFKGISFQSDTDNNFYSNSNYISYPNASSEKIFQSHRFANELKYAIPVPNGTYTVITYHNETYFGKRISDTGPGRRVFDIFIEGERVKTKLDLYRESGNKPIALEFTDVKVADGKMNIDMVASANNATISGIAIIDSSNKILASSANLREIIEEDSSDDPEINEVTPFGQLQDFTIYPNPASEIATVKIQKDIGKFTLFIHNASGQMIQYHDSNTIYDGNGEYKFHVNQLQKGIYIITISPEKGGIERLKLMVNP
ncbi:malectin domain-containing carbohydrate-binding protein [Negadavirga shengliensis]|uniref:Malectin domain-containing carbohydrate-binding protein n=1 Tax=Negadavirga shengliensis TaxID=1389218 RepID=A0ABV9T4G8_9BACT